MPNDYPKGIIAIYDIDKSMPKCLDRYTVYYSRRVCPANPGMHGYLAMSCDPFAPYGFAQHGEGLLGKHNGKRIKWEDLPEDCRKCAVRDLE